MSATACRACLLRSTLLAELSPVIDLRSRERLRLPALLALEDEELIELLGGRRREALREAHRGGRPAPGCSQTPAVCVHHGLFPRRLDSPGAPRLFYLQGDSKPLQECDRRPAVAVLGTTRPSDYGSEMARALAHSLACEGVLIVTLLADGIPRAARSGVRTAGRGGLVLSGSGLRAPIAVDARPRADASRSAGCLVSELPPGCPGRRWGGLAAERAAVQLSDLVLVVEAESEHELFAVELARANGVLIGAVPGRATASLAQGPLELLRSGSTLVRSSADVLEQLGRPALAPSREAAGRALPGRLGRLLDRVGCGQETPEQLLRGADPDQTLIGLAELELMGRVRRTGDGRYVVSGGVPIT